MWKLRLIGFFMLLFVAMPATAEETKDNTPQAMPFAEADEREYVFPSILEGDEARHAFVIRNTGEAPLIIERVNTG